MTPVFYTVESLPAVTRFFVSWLNPLTPFLTALRSLLVAGSPAEPVAYAYAMFMSLVVFGVGYAAFLRLESAALERA